MLKSIKIKVISVSRHTGAAQDNGAHTNRVSILTGTTKYDLQASVAHDVLFIYLFYNVQTSITSIVYMVT